MSSVNVPLPPTPLCPKYPTTLFAPTITINPHHSAHAAQQDFSTKITSLANIMTRRELPPLQKFCNQYLSAFATELAVVL